LGQDQDFLVETDSEIGYPAEDELVKQTHTIGERSDKQKGLWGGEQCSAFGIVHPRFLWKIWHYDCAP